MTAETCRVRIWRIQVSRGDIGIYGYFVDGNAETTVFDKCEFDWVASWFHHRVVSINWLLTKYTKSIVVGLCLYYPPIKNSCEGCIWDMGYSVFGIRTAEVFQTLTISTGTIHKYFIWREQKNTPSESHKLIWSQGLAEPTRTRRRTTHTDAKTHSLTESKYYTSGYNRARYTCWG